MKKLLILAALLAGLLTGMPAFAAMHTSSLSADGTACFSPSMKTVADTWKATVRVYGTWGSGTITWFTRTGTSNDVPETDLTGVASTSTSDEEFNVELGKASYSGTDMKLCGTLAGATNPSLTLELYDNN